MHPHPQLFFVIHTYFTQKAALLLPNFYTQKNDGCGSFLLFLSPVEGSVTDTTHRGEDWKGTGKTWTQCSASPLPSAGAVGGSSSRNQVWWSQTVPWSSGRQTSRSDDCRPCTCFIWSEPQIYTCSEQNVDRITAVQTCKSFHCVKNGCKLMFYGGKDFTVCN